jgi:hypothetical protein
MNERNLKVHAFKAYSGNIHALPDIICDKFSRMSFTNEMNGTEQNLFWTQNLNTSVNHISKISYLFSVPIQTERITEAEFRVSRIIVNLHKTTCKCLDEMPRMRMMCVQNNSTWSQAVIENGQKSGRK